MLKFIILILIITRPFNINNVRKTAKPLHFWIVFYVDCDDDNDDNDQSLHVSIFRKLREKVRLNHQSQQPFSDKFTKKGPNYYRTILFRFTELIWSIETKSTTYSRTNMKRFHINHQTTFSSVGRTISNTQQNIAPKQYQHTQALCMEFRYNIH